MPTAKPRTKIVKKDPPPKKVPRYDWAAIAEQLKADPGVWHQIYEKDKTGYAVAVSNDDIAPLRSSLGFQVRTANNTRGRPANGTDPGEARTCSLYLRWVKPKRMTKKKEA